MPDKSLEQQMQEMLSGLEFKPDDKVWEVIRTEIREDKKRRFVFWWWLLPALLVGAIATGLYLHNTSKTSTTNTLTGIHTTVPAKENLPATQGSKTGIDNNTTQTEQADKTIAKENNPHTNAGNIVNTTENNTVAYIPAKEEPQVMLKEKAAENKTLTQQEIPVNNTPQTATANNLSAGTTATTPNAEVPVMQPPATEPVADKKNETGKTEIEKKDVQKDSGANAAPVISTAKSKKWKFSVMADGGVAKLSKALIPGSGADKAASDFYSVTNPNAGASQNYILTYTQQTQLKGYSLSVGMHAEKSIDDRWSFITGVQYQYVHYTSRTYTSRDSFAYLQNSSSFLNTGRIASGGSEINYSLHYLSVPVLLQYKIITPLYLFGGLQNGFFISGTKREEKKNFLAQTSSSSKSGAKENVYSYQPAFTFGANVALYDDKKYTWFIAPHIDYGLSKTFKASLDRNNALRYGVQLSVQLKK